MVPVTPAPTASAVVAGEAAPARASTTASLCLLGEFRLVAGSGETPVPAGSGRLLALLALRGRRLRRSVVAGTLWPDASEQHAGTCLRSALLRLDPASRHSVDISPGELAIRPGVRVDLRDAQVVARRLVTPGTPLTDADRAGATVETLDLELLPGWDEDWVAGEAEGWRQLRLHALERLAARLTAERCYGLAMLAALAAVRAEPLRESARTTLIDVHLAEGNRSEAMLEFRRYRTLLHTELGVEPSPALRTRALGGTPT
jgi:SARP family transcriptional regulator, regulator of embCAB operon